MQTGVGATDNRVLLIDTAGGYDLALNLVQHGREDIERLEIRCGRQERPRRSMIAAQSRLSRRGPIADEIAP